MTEAVYFDIDGTLRDEVTGVPESTVFALKACRNEGIKVIICTGRNRASIQDDVLALPYDGIIYGGGCYIEYGSEKIFSRQFSASLMEMTASLAAELNLSIAAETEHIILMNGGAAEFYKVDAEIKYKGFTEKQKKQIILKNKIKPENNFYRFEDEKNNIHKICLLGDEAEIFKVKSILRSKAEVVQQTQWRDKFYLELLPKGCNKGSALRLMNSRLRISRENTLCFGDSENDISMMKEAGTAVGMGNCSRKLIKYVSSVCETAVNDGIYNELVRRKIIKPRREQYGKAMVAGRGYLPNLS